MLKLVPILTPTILVLYLVSCHIPLVAILLASVVVAAAVVHIVVIDKLCLHWIVLVCLTPNFNAAPASGRCRRRLQPPAFLEVGAASITTHDTSSSF